MDYNLMVILGPTASGKTKLAVSVAKALHTEIISADSRQIFKRMNIGTGKDLSEYEIDNQKIPYHLIDIKEPGERYHVDAFKNDFFDTFQNISETGKLPILCGGTGLYIQSILQDQPLTAVPKNEQYRTELEKFDKADLIDLIKATVSTVDVAKIDLSSKKRIIRALEVVEYLKHHTLPQIERPKLKPLIFGLKTEVEITRTRILNRLNKRLAEGMVEEVERLIADGVSTDVLIFYGLEYKFIVNYLSGNLSFDDLKLKLGTAICQYAKRQNTYFRKMEKDGILINWLDSSLENNLLKHQILEKVLSK